MLNSILNLATTFFLFHNSDHSTHCNLGNWESVFWRQRSELPSNVVRNSDRVIFIAKIFNWYLILCYEFFNIRMWQQQSAEIHAPDWVAKTTAASNLGSFCLHYHQLFCAFYLTTLSVLQIMYTQRLSDFNWIMNCRTYGKNWWKLI
jgi:hypothetical protein